MVVIFAGITYKTIDFASGRFIHFKGDKMALSKVQTFIKKLSNSPNVKKVVGDIQTISEDLQKRVQNLTKEDAIKKYKEIMKKVGQTENDLEK